MEVLEWQALSVQHLVCPSKQRIDVECTGIHTAFIVPHTIPTVCSAPSSCPVFCPSSSIPFPENTTIIAGDVYSHPSSPSSSPYPSHFAAVFDCPEGVHTLAGALQSPLQARKRVHSNMCILIFMCASLRPR